MNTKDLLTYFQDYDADDVEVKRVDNKLEVTPLSSSPTHISEIRFDNESWTISSFELKYSYKELMGDVVKTQVETDALYKGQKQTISFAKISPDITGALCPTIKNGIRVESSFNSDTCNQRWLLDPDANLRAIYRATGTEFKLTLHYDGTETVYPPVPAGDGDLCITNTCGVSTLQGLLQQVIIKENGANYFSKTWDTSNASESVHVGLKKGANYAIQLREVYNMAMPSDVPAYVYINAYINIKNCQAHNGTLTLIGTGVPTGKEDYTLTYNNTTYQYSATLNIQDA